MATTPPDPAFPTRPAPLARALLWLALCLAAAGCAATNRPPASRDYVVALLRAGPKPPATDQVESLMQGHMQNMRELWDRGALLFAGPFDRVEGADYRGLFVFDVTTVEEAAALTASDPAVMAGALTAELVPMHCGQQLTAVLELDRLAEAQRAQSGNPDPGMRQYVLALVPPGQARAAAAVGVRAVLRGELGAPRDGQTLLVLDVPDTAAARAVQDAVGGRDWELLPWWGTLSLETLATLAR